MGEKCLKQCPALIKYDVKCVSVTIIFVIIRFAISAIPVW